MLTFPKKCVMWFGAILGSWEGEVLMSFALTREQASWRWRVLASTYIGYIGYYLTRKTFTICKTSIAEDLGWQLGDTAYIWAAFLFAYMIGQFINGFIGRKWGARLILLLGLGVSIICNVLFGITNSFAWFLVFMFVNGLVQASGWPGCIGGVAEWIRSKERGTIMGVWTTNHIVGNIVYKSLGGYLLAVAGWRSAFFGLTFLTLATWALMYFWLRNRPQDVNLPPIVDKDGGDERLVEANEEAHASLGDYLKLAVNPLVMAMGVTYLCIKFLRYALDSWLPAFLNMQGLDVGQASYWSMGFDITGLVGAIAAGWALDKIFKGNWAVLCCILGVGSIVGYLAVIMAGSNPIIVALCFGIVGFMVYGPDSILTGAAAISVAGEANGIAVAGLVNAIGSSGPVIQELVIGKLMRGNDNATNIFRANVLTLSVSVVFVLLMLVLALRMHYVAKAKKSAS
jgi:sugar phosphate permease